MKSAKNLGKRWGILTAFVVLNLAAGLGHGKITTVTYQVSASADDGYAWSATEQDISSTYLMIGDERVYAVPYYMSAMRFTNAAIPRSAAITEAHLKIRSLNEGVKGQIYGLIQAESTDDAADFSLRYIAAASKTTAGANWDHKFAWDKNTWQISPDIASVVQEVVNRPDWNSGNSMAVFYSTRADSGKSRMFGSFDSGSSYAPVLEISFEAYTISGAIRGVDGNGVEGVVVSAGDGVEAVVTDGNGYYELLIAGGWSGTVTPEKAGWGFSPSSRVYAGVMADQTGQDYVGIQPRISGYVRDVNGAGFDGAVVSAGHGGGSTTAGNDGYYELVVPYGWFGEVRCSKPGVYFDPHKRVYESMTGDVSGEDYTAVIAMQIYDSLGGADDGYVCGGGAQNLTEAYLYVGGTCFGGIRFTDVQIPKCSTIHYAFLRLRVEYQQNRSAARYGVIQAEASDNPEDFSVLSLNSRVKTEASVNWDFPNGLDLFGWPGFHNSPNIASVLQEVINREGWEQGNSLVVFYSGRPEAGSTTAGWHTRDVFPQYRPELAVFFDYPVMLAGFVRTNDGNGVEGVRVTAGNGGSRAYTDSNGYYEVLVPLYWSGTLTPSRLARTFNPESRSYENLSTNLTDQDFIASQPLKISGHVIDSNGAPFEGVFISPDSEGATSDTTDANGYYELEVLQGWTGTVTPNRSGWAFSPGSRTYTNLMTDQTDHNYAGSQPKISGYVKNQDGAGIMGIVLAADNSGGSGVTDETGYYDLTVPCHWSGSVARSGGAAPLDPPSRSYSDVTADLTSQNFTLFPVTVRADGTGDYATIQAAINAAGAGDIIILADGTYTGGGNRDLDFKGKAITLRSQKGPENCVIDSETTQGHRGFYFHSGEDPNSLVSGLTITGGNKIANGGGIYCSGASPTIENCIITANKCYGHSISMDGGSACGGAISCRSGSKPLIVGCTISNNRAQGGDGKPLEGYDCPFSGGSGLGGGIYCDAASNPVVVRSIFTGNRAIGGKGYPGMGCAGAGGHAYGGALYANSTTPTIVERSVFLNNSALGGNSSSGGYCGSVSSAGNGLGGGIYSGQDSIVLRNCSVVGNTTHSGDGPSIYAEGVGYGAGLYGSIEVSGCTFVANTAEHRGGAIYGSSSVTNCVLWNNTAPSGSQIYGGTSVSYSDVQSGFTGEGNINTSPLFENPVDGVYHLSQDSPCINAGDPNYIADTEETDIDGEARLNGGRIDMGADEFFSPTPFIWLSAARFDFTAYIDGNESSPQALLISNMGPNELPWEITKDCSWISVEPESGICPAGGVDQVMVGVDTSSLPGGTHSCALNILAPSASNSPLIVSVILRLYGPVISLSSNDIDFVAAADNPYPPDQILCISNNGYSTLNWQISIPNDCTWLTVYPTTGVSAGQVNDVTLSVDAAGLDYGFYSCDLTVSDFYADNSPQSVQVGLYVCVTEGQLIVPAVFPTIQEAVDAAVDGDEVVVAPGTYTGLGNFDVDFQGKAITVRSIEPNNPNVAVSTIVDGNGGAEYDQGGSSGFGFILANGEGPNSVVDGLTITGASWGGGVYLIHTSPTIRNCIIRDNWGNGILGNVTGDLTITGCTISSNTGGEWGGGGIHLSGTGTVTISNCLISDNHNYWWGDGGGIRYYWWSEEGPPATLNLFDCVITGNSSNRGGGVYCEAGTCTITNCNITDNLATENGGGIHLGQEVVATVANSTISRNRTGVQGSGIYCLSSNATVSTCEISGNTAGDSGGGICCDSSNPTITNCTISNNSAAFVGGAICCWRRNSPTISNCILSGNKSYDGAALADGSGPITNCTIVGNLSTDPYSGATICRWAGLVNNCIIWGNRSATEMVVRFDPMYSCIEGGHLGPGNIDVDPCFAIPGFWDPNGTPDDANDDFWVDGDYHLKSRAGRWQPSIYNKLDPTHDGFINLTDFAALAEHWQQIGGFLPSDLDYTGCVDFNDLRLLLDNYLAEYPPGEWVFDEVTSPNPCIDAGDPNSDWTAELWPHGKHINMGAYGGTPEASMSPSIAGNIADLNADDVVNFGDFTQLGRSFGFDEVLLAEDFDRNGIVNFNDVSIFVDNWLWEQ